MHTFWCHLRLVWRSEITSLFNSKWQKLRTALFLPLSFSHTTSIWLTKDIMIVSKSFCHWWDKYLWAGVEAIEPAFFGPRGFIKRQGKSLRSCDWVRSTSAVHGVGSLKCPSVGCYVDMWKKSPHAGIFISKRADYHQIFQIALPSFPLQHQGSLQSHRGLFSLILHWQVRVRGPQERMMNCMKWTHLLFRCSVGKMAFGGL